MDYSAAISMPMSIDNAGLPAESGGVKVDLDKLPLKRMLSIDEFGSEIYPPSTSSEEQYLLAIRRIDFTPVVEKCNYAKKQKESQTTSTSAASKEAWPWQGLIESLQQAQQEISIILDLIKTVEVNDAVTVAGMQKPKQSPDEVLADLSVSAATKLQRLRHVARYFKQSARTLEQRVSKEARFYGSLIRLQQNWKIKRQRLPGSALGKESFIFDLSDNYLSSFSGLSWRSPLSTVQINQSSTGILDIQKPQKSCRLLSLMILGKDINSRHRRRRKEVCSFTLPLSKNKEVLNDEDVNNCVKHTHSCLRWMHSAIFEEQVFDMVNHESYNNPHGIHVTGMQEHFLRLVIGPDDSLCLFLIPSGEVPDVPFSEEGSSERAFHSGSPIHMNNSPSANVLVAANKDDNHINITGESDAACLEIYLLNIFHEHALTRVKEKQASMNVQTSTLPTREETGLLGHFCKTVAHRIFSKKLLALLESLVSRIPYLQLLSEPTWHSRMSSWSLCFKVAQPLHADRLANSPKCQKTLKSNTLRFYTKIVLQDGQITLSGENSPSVISSFTDYFTNPCLVNEYNCGLNDLPTIIVQQVAVQIIQWLHEEALVHGINARRDFLSLYFEMDQGETLCLLAHVDPEDEYGSISWWMFMPDQAMEEDSHFAIIGNSSDRRFLGYLSLEKLHSTLMDLIALCRKDVAQ